jgi:hypothetical protein
MRIRMGKCPSCQKKSLFLKKSICLVCGKSGCENCFSFLFRISDYNYSKLEDAYVCSKNCFESLATQIEDQIKPSEITVENIIPPFHFFVERLFFSPSSFGKLSPELMSYIRDKRKLHIWFLKANIPLEHRGKLGLNFDGIIEDHLNPLWKRLSRRVLLIRAKHFETLREFENAAKIYRRLRMYEQAGRVRAKRDELTVKKTDISLNLNALLKQIKDSGIVAIYRCPHCNGKLKVGGKTTLKSLRTCEHCGSEIEAMNLADFLKTALT